MLQSVCQLEQRVLINCKLTYLKRSPALRQYLQNFDELEVATVGLNYALGMFCKWKELGILELSWQILVFSTEKANRALDRIVTTRHPQSNKIYWVPKVSQTCVMLYPAACRAKSIVIPSDLRPSTTHGHRYRIRFMT